MADKKDTANGGGVPLSGGPVYDQDLYGSDKFSGYERSIGVAEDEDADERERLVARWGEALGRKPTDAASHPVCQPSTLCTALMLRPCAAARDAAQ
jgi:hypothetical protein